MSGLAHPPGRCSFTSLAGEPVSRFYQENVARAPEDASSLATRAEITLEWQEVFALLLPNKKEGRTGPVFPAHHRISPQRMSPEIGIADRERWRDARTIGIYRIRLRFPRRRIEHRRDRAAIVLPVNQIFLRSRFRQLLEPLEASR